MLSSVSWLSLCMYILGSLWLDTFSFIHCQSLITVIQLVICICTFCVFCGWTNTLFLHCQSVIIVIQLVICICIFCVFRGWINTCLYTVTQCFMYGVWLVWRIHDGFSLYGYRCLSSQIWICVDCKVLHHLYIFIVFQLWFNSIRSSWRLHCVIVYLHTYSLSHFDVVLCLKSQIWIYMLGQHLRYSWSSH